MRSIPIFIAILSILLWTNVSLAQGIEIEGGVAYDRTNAEGFDLERRSIRAQFLQRIKLSKLKLPLFVGAELIAIEQELTDDHGPELIPYETETGIANLLLGFGFGDEEGSENAGFSWRTLFGPSIQYAEAFEENFFLAGATIKTELNIELYEGSEVDWDYYLLLRASGRLGTDSSHASGIGQTGFSWEFTKLTKVHLAFGAGIRAKFFVQNLGINSKLEQFIVEVDVALLAGEVFLEIWKVRASGFHSPEFAGRLTSQSHLGVANNSGAEHSGAMANLMLDF
jgi:hypothetical protein